MQITSNAAGWYHSGKPVVPMRWVVMGAPAGRCEPRALLATHQRLTPVQSLRYFVQRWQMEATFEEPQAH